MDGRRYSYSGPTPLHRATGTTTLSKHQPCTALSSSHGLPGTPRAIAFRATPARRAVKLAHLKRVNGWVRPGVVEILWRLQDRVMQAPVA